MTTRLGCIECGTLGLFDARGWRAYRSDLEEDGDALEIALFRPVCVEHQFGHG